MGKKEKLLILGIIIFVGVGLFLFVKKDKGTPTPTVAVTSPSPSASPNGTIYQPIKMTDGLIIQDLILGTGAEAVSGHKITVNYSGTLVNGTKFDNSYDRGVPFSFNLGAGEVIKGWDEGFAGMKIGGKRKLTIPSELGYGSQDMGVIPPNSTLIFEVELISVN